MVAILADGEGGRAATVGWIVLVAAIVVAVGALTIFAVTTGENALDRLADRMPTFSVGWWALLAAGLALLAIGFVFQVFGIGLLGAILAILTWRLSQRG